MQDEFLNIPFEYNTLDKYYVRTSILKAVENNFNSFEGNLLDIGCGKMPYKKFILANSTVKNYTGMDIESALIYDTEVKPDIYWDGVQIPFYNETFETVIATEVLEHCPEPLSILKEIYRVLKPGSIFFFTVPFLWSLHEVPHDEFRYTPFSLKRLCIDAGFSNIQINSLGGWHASLAQMLGLWVRRAPMQNKKRQLLSYFFKPVIAYLIKKDKGLRKEFYEGQMITGIYGVCKK